MEMQRGGYCQYGNDKESIIEIAKDLWYIKKADIEYMELPTTTFLQCQQRMRTRRMEA